MFKLFSASLIIVAACAFASAQGPASQDKNEPPSLGVAPKTENGSKSQRLSPAGTGRADKRSGRSGARDFEKEVGTAAANISAPEERNVHRTDPVLEEASPREASRLLLAETLLMAGRF